MESMMVIEDGGRVFCSSYWAHLPVTRETKAQQAKQKKAINRRNQARDEGKTLP
jgi:hypothetical protein